MVVPGVALQAPPEQMGVPPLHVTPQQSAHVAAPSQPSAGLALQFAKFTSHDPPHTLAVHDTLYMLLVEHVAPHAPQFETSFVVLTSQPSAFLLALQSANPALHVPPHVGAVQLTVAWFVPTQSPATVQPTPHPAPPHARPAIDVCPAGHTQSGAALTDLYCTTPPVVPAPAV